MPKIIAPPANELNETIEKRPIITTCPHCQYTISYTEDEVERVDNESMGVICPQCRGVIETEHVESFTFPKTFFHFGEGKDGNFPCILTDEETQQYVDIVKRKLQQELQVGEYTFTGTGDTMVFGFKMEDEDVIFVTKNYWSDSVFKN